MGTIKLKSTSAKAEQNATSYGENVSNVEGVFARAMCGRWDDPAVLKEFSEKTDETSRHYKLNNGTAKSVISAAQSNYYDEIEQKWKAIDNSLTETAQGYESTCGKYKTVFSKPEQAKSVKITTSGFEISWTYLGKQTTATPEIVRFAAEEPVSTSLNVEASIQGALKSKGSQVIYQNADRDTDIEYSLSGNNVKENIVVKERAEEYKYLFALNTQGLKLRVSEDNESLELYTESVNESGETVTKTAATIPAPFMYDANGESSEDVYFELAPETDGKYTFAVIADAEWINAAERVFPITIDPQIVTCGSEYFSKTVQYRNIYTSYSSGCYQTTYSNWYTTSSSYIRVSRTSSLEYKTTLTINKAGLPKLDYPVSNVKLILTPYRITQSGYCSIGGKNIYLSDTSKKTNSFTVVVEPRSTYSVNAEFYASGANAPYIEVEYLINGKKKLFIQPFTLVGGATGQYDVTTGDASVAFEDVPASDSLLGIGISHVYKKSSENLHVGNNFRLSLNETLSKTGAAALDADYVYTDAMGMKHGFKDTYYYINSSGVKISISKSLVTVELDGRLTYTTGDQTFEVKKEQRTLSGLTAITQYEGFKGVKWLEQRLDEQKQLEQQIDSYCNTLKEFVVVDKNNGEILCCMTGEPSETYESFIGGVYGSNILLTKSEAFSLQSLRLQENSLIDQLISLNHQKTSLGHSETSLYYQYLTMENTKPQTADPEDSDGNITYVNVDNQNTYNNNIKDNLHEQYEFVATSRNDVDNSKNNTEDQKALVESQIEYYIEKSEVYKQQIEEYYKEYINLKYQHDQLILQTPVNYIMDGTIIKGFNEDGRLVAIFDKYENTMSIEYDEEGKIVNVYDGENKQIVFEYRPDGLLRSITDTRGRRIVYDYDNGRLVSVIKFDGKELTFEYDENNPDYLTSVTTSDHLQSVLKYTSGLLSEVTAKSFVSGILHGQEPTVTDGVTLSTCSFSFGDNLTTISDDKENRKFYKIDDEGDVYEYYEEENGKIVKAEKYDYVPGESNTQGKDDVYTSSVSLMYQKSFDEFVPDFDSGDFMKTVLDEFNNPVTVTTNAQKLSDGTTQQTTVNYTYNDDHKCIKESATVTIKEGTSVLKTYTQIMSYNYNAKGNIVRKESYVVGEEYTTGKSIEETVYDEKGNVAKSFTYNSLDSSSKFYTESEYAEDGQTLADYDETGENKTEYEYISGTNVLRSQKLPNGSKFAYGHDVDDTVTSITQSTEEGEENSTHTRYTCGEVTELVSGNNVVRYAYDGKQRVTQVYLNDLGNAYLRNTFTDDTTLSGVTGKVDKCVSTNAKNESVTSYTDKQGKLCQVTLSSGKEVKYTYNTKGEVTSVVDGVSGLTETYGYDSFDRVKNYARGSEYTEGYEYDAYGSVSSVTLGGGVSRTYTYAYKSNAARELESITSDGYKYVPQTDKLGRNAGREVVSGTTKIAGEYIYYRKVGDHATNMPSSVYFGNRKNGKYVISDNVKYEYDKNGNICKIYENGALTARYTYDALDRLVREDNKKFGKTYLYAYDNCGNILSRRKTNFTLKEDVEECTFDSVQYAYEGDRLVSVGDEACTYDEIGNPKTYRGKAVTWANGRQMTKFDTTAFVYDGQGRRRSKGSISFTYDKDGRVVKQSNGLEFIYDQSGIAGIKYNNATYFYRKDAQGNIAAILDSNGNIVVEYKYDSWGNHAVLDANGADIASATHIGNLNPFRYRGYYYDTETGLYFLKTRYYDPEVGRFITIDDISYIDPETINGLNLYAYCGNNPVMRVDETGTEWWHWLAGILAVVGVALVVGAITVLTAGVGTTIMVGTLAGAVLHGAAIGTLIGAGVGLVAGGIIGGAVSGWSAEGILTGMGIGLGVGAIIGAIIGGVSGGIHYAWQQSVLSKASSFSSGGKTELHHIVEQCQQGKSGFAKELIRNAKNEIRIDKALHGKISGYYSSFYKKFGIRFRDYLAMKNYSFGKQYNIGIKIINMILKMFG